MHILNELLGCAFVTLIIAWPTTVLYVYLSHRRPNEEASLFPIKPGSEAVLRRARGPGATAEAGQVLASVQL